MTDLITAVEYAQIDTVPLATPAWRVVDLATLWETADQEGADTPIPGAHGARANPRWRRPTKVMLELWIRGEYDRTGATNTDGRAGLWANVAVIRGLCAPPGNATGTRTLTVHVAGAAAISGPVHVTKLTLGAFSPTIRKATLELSIPAGELA